MNKDDFLYLFTFYISLVLGYIDRNIESRKIKQIYGSIAGFVLGCLLCGTEIVQPLINIIANACIITFCDRKRCHVFSLIFTFTYLYFCRKCSPSSFTNLILMSTTLRMIGIANEVSDEDLSDNDKKCNNTQRTKRSSKITFKDIVFYGINYIGFPGAPYYTYSTYDDYLSLPFKRYYDWKSLCVYKLACSNAILLGHLIIDRIWPIQYMFTDEFYTNETLMYRIWYVYPICYAFLFRLWHAFLLLECCCCINGLGVYPKFTKPKCVYGPTENLDEMMAMTNENDLKKQAYSFATIENADMVKFHSMIWIGEALRQWNMTIQRWLYTVIYKKIPYKTLKKPATMFISSYWHGIHLGYFASIFSSSLILVVDKRWQLLLNNKKSFVTKLLLQMVKFHFFYNTITSFLLRNLEDIMKFQKSIYYNYVIIFFLYYILLLIVERMRKCK